MKARTPVSAWWKAQELLARRDHGSQELINKLKQRGFPDDEIAAAVKRLFEKGILDDEAFAERLTEELFLRRGYGYHMILLRLRKKGLDSDLCQRMVKNFFSGIDNDEMTAVILRLLARRQAREPDKSRLFAWLKRRGFRSDEIKRALAAREEMIEK